MRIRFKDYKTTFSYNRYGIVCSATSYCCVTITIKKRYVGVYQSLNYSQKVYSTCRGFWEFSESFQSYLGASENFKQFLYKVRALRRRKRRQ